MAGMTKNGRNDEETLPKRHPDESRDPEYIEAWIPAYAGMTKNGRNDEEWPE